MKISLFIMILISTSCATTPSLPPGEACSKIETQKNTASIATTSPVNKDEVRNTLHASIPKIVCCYQEEIDTGIIERTQTMEFKFTVGNLGKVIKSELYPQNVMSSEGYECMKYILNGTQFPNPGEGKTYDVSQPINLHPRKR